MVESIFAGRAAKERWQRLDGIDCLRALAIFYVLMNHVNMRLWGAHIPYMPGWPHQLVTSLVWEGQAGVQIFFAVSGFLITATSIQRWGTLAKVGLRDFYLIRFARIAPLLLTLLGVLSILHLLKVNHYVVSQKDGGLPNALFAALTFRTGLLEATAGYLPGNWDILWSLSVEELFYLFSRLRAGCFIERRAGVDGWWRSCLSSRCWARLPAQFLRTVIPSGGNIPISAAWTRSRSAASQLLWLHTASSRAALSLQCLDAAWLCSFFA
jgi:peptidoglycan/LPS O-acetylase OafA/YrhL